MKNISLLIVITMLLTSLVIAEGQIDISYAGYTISQPGSYIVVKDLTTGINLNCITITTSNVTLDLNGHTLYGAGSTVGTGGIGIFASSLYNNIAVYNGVVRDFRGHGIFLGGTNHQVSRIRAFGNGWDGINLGNNGTAWDNTVQKNGLTGIIAWTAGVLRDNSVHENGAYGIYAQVAGMVKGNSVYNNGADGIFAYFGCTVTGNSVYNNGADGIFCGYGSTVNGNSAYTNKGDAGIYAIAGSTIIGNNAYNNNNDGINGGIGSTVKENTVIYNIGDGIEVSSDCKVVGNTCISNGYGGPTASGIRAIGNDNSIENNLLTDNDIGLFLSVASSFYGSNRASGNTISNYSTVGGQTDGGTINTALTNISFYTQPNFLVRHFAGFEIPVLKESQYGIIRNLKY